MPRPLPFYFGQLTRNPLFQVDKIKIRTRNQGKRPKNDGQLDRQESKEPDYSGDTMCLSFFHKNPAPINGAGHYFLFSEQAHPQVFSACAQPRSQPARCHPR